MLIKKILRIIVISLALVLSVVLVLGILVIAQRVDPRQYNFVVDNYDFPDTLNGLQFDIDSLKNLMAGAKSWPEAYETAALLAYTAYPELKEANIDIVMTNAGPPMQANIKVLSLFGPARNRVYAITLNDAQNTYFEPILMRSLPFDAQVGILAHELGHIAYYHRHSALQIAKWGIEYLLDAEFRATHERTTDLMPIYHGLGSQIYQYAWFVRKHPSSREFYEQGKGFMDTYYMTDLEIKAALEEYHAD